MWRTVARWLGLEVRSGLTYGQLMASLGISESTSDGTMVVTEAMALNLSAVWCAVQNIAGTVGSLPLILYKRTGDDGENRVRYAEHPLYRVLHDQPNPEMSSMVFRETVQAHVLLWGNGYAEIQRDQANRVRALLLITPDRVTPKRDDRSGALYYEIRNGARAPARMAPADIFHVRGPSWDGITGYSVVAKARQSLGLGLQTERFGATLFGNGPKWSGILTHPKTMRPETKAALRADLKNLAPNDFAMLEEGLTWNQTGMPAKDAEFLATRQFQVEEISRWFNMPPHKLKDLTRATFCLPADALVATEHGPRPIAAVAVGDRVWSRAGDRWVLAEVSKSGCTGVDELIEITAGLRTLRCTAGHRVPVRRSTLVPFQAGRGKAGRGSCVVVDGTRYRRARAVVWIPAGEIVPGDELLAAQGLPDLGGTSCPTRTTVTESFMEVLGFYLGDGFVFPAGFGFSHAKDADYLAHYVEAVCREFTSIRGHYAKTEAHPCVGCGALLTTSRSHCDGRCRDRASRAGAHPENRGILPKRRDPNTTVFYSTSARRELDALGLTGTARTKQVPPWIFGLSHVLQRAFLRGYLDADGTVDPHGHIRYVSVSRPLLDAIRHLCLGVGLRVANHGLSVINATFPQYGTKTHRLHRIILTDPVLNATLIGTHTRMYQARWDALRRRPRRVPVSPGEAARRRDVLPGIALTRVRSIVRTGRSEPVYDLTVAGTHTFIADGTLCHNSNIEHEGISYLTDTIRPWLVLWEQEIQSKLISPLETQIQYAEFLVDALLRADSLSKAQTQRIYVDGGILSVNEIRRMENRNALEGDVYDLPHRAGNLGGSDTGTKEAPPPPKREPTRSRPDYAAAAAKMLESALAAIERERKALPPPSVEVLPAGIVEDVQASMLSVREETVTTIRAVVTDLVAEIQRALPPPPAEELPVPAEPEPPEEEAPAAPRYADVMIAQRQLIADVVGRMQAREKDKARLALKSPERLRAWIGAFYPRHAEVFRAALLPHIALHLALTASDGDPDQVTRALVEEYVHVSQRQLHALLDAAPADLGAEVEALFARWDLQRTHSIPDTVMREEMAHHG